MLGAGLWGDSVPVPDLSSSASISKACCMSSLLTPMADRRSTVFSRGAPSRFVARRRTFVSFTRRRSWDFLHSSRAFISRWWSSAVVVKLLARAVCPTVNSGGRFAWLFGPTVGLRSSGKG